MRVVRLIAAFVALGTVAFAVGDFARHPNTAGALGLVLVIAVFALLLAFLFRPRHAPAPAAEREPEPEPRRHRRSSSAAAGVWTEGWDASEAERARERRPGR